MPEGRLRFSIIDTNAGHHAVAMIADGLLDVVHGDGSVRMRIHDEPSAHKLGNSLVPAIWPARTVWGEAATGRGRPKRHRSEVTTMRKRIRGIAAIGLALIVTGCGGDGAVSTQAPVSTAASEGEAGDGAASTSVPATVTTQPAGGGTAVGVCDLVTAEELAEIFGVASVTTTVLTGPPDNCIVASDAGDPLTAWSLNTAQASNLFDTFTADPSSIEVPGIGEKAAIVQNTGLLVLIHDNLIVISISGGADLSEEEAVEASKRIGAIAAGRM